MRRVALLVLVIGLFAGCGASVAGEPVAAGTTRPRDIRLDGLDPCALFTPEVRAKLGTDRPPRFDKRSIRIYRGEVPACDVRRDQSPRFNVSVTFALLDGIELYRADRVLGTLERRTIQGFPALLLTPSTTSDNCAVFIDIAPGQLIAVLYADGGDRPPISLTQLCKGAEKAADLTLAALLALS